MIVWICSFPRSGRKWLRQILGDNFNIEKDCIFNVNRSSNLDFNFLRNDPKLNFCMTHLRAHELDINKGDKVLFPVRHPFNVLYSSLNWLKKKHGLDVSEKDLLLSDSSIFCQETQWNYRDYMNSWSPILLNSRLQVLILKYEDRSRVFKKEINKISNFLNVDGYFTSK